MQVRAQQGDTVDKLCQRHYGRTAGVTEAVLIANPGLAQLGAVLPHGTAVVLPEVNEEPRKTLINLWD